MEIKEKQMEIKGKTNETKINEKQTKKKMNRKVKTNVTFREFTDKFKGVLLPLDLLKISFSDRSEKEIKSILYQVVLYSLTGQFDENSITKNVKLDLIYWKKEMDLLLRKYITKEGSINPIVEEKPTTQEETKTITSQLKKRVITNKNNESNLGETLEEIECNLFNDKPTKPSKEQWTEHFREYSYNALNS